MLDFPLMPEQASTVAGEVDAIYFFLIALSAFFSVLVAGLILFFAARYRRTHEGQVGEPIHGSTLLEVTWSVIPLVLVMISFFWGANLFLRLSRPPADAVEYWAVGKQWMWKFQHPDGLREINDLHVPVGVPIKITMTSEDVLHDLFLPAFRVKADVVPGRYTTVWFEATKTGTYHLFCAEYCGVEHSRMIGKVVVMEQDEYAAFVASAGVGGTMRANGEQLFAQLACNTCHELEGTGRGPSLHGLYGTESVTTTGQAVVADDSYLRESILQPQAKIKAGYEPIMPTYQGQVNEESIQQLISYIKSLAPVGEATAAAAAPAEGQAAAEAI
jgi:cytochrome c oxidase subunit 2